MRRRAKVQAEADEGGICKKNKRKNEPPVVEEGAEEIRRRRGERKNKAFARNFTLKPMRSIAPLLRCDPARLERIRQKEKDNKHKANTDVPIMPHTASTSHEPSRSTDLEVRANVDDSKRQRTQRKDFNKLIQLDIEAQAAKRRRTSQDKPNLASTNSTSSHEVRQSQRAAEFKDIMPTNARGRNEHHALFRLLSGGHRDNELHAGRQHHTLNDRTSEFRPA